LKEQLRGRDFLTLMDYTKKEINYLLDVASSLKACMHALFSRAPLVGKSPGKR